jgi:hypothetical protein
MNPLAASNDFDSRVRVSARIATQAGGDRPRDPAGRAMDGAVQKEIMLERVTNISMGTEIDNVVEFEELALAPEDAPNAFGMLE